MFGLVAMRFQPVTEAWWKIRVDAAKRRSKMPLTRDFKETIRERARRDAAFREALLKEAVDALLSGDVETGKIVLRDYINATVGFDKLATVTKRSPRASRVCSGLKVTRRLVIFLRLSPIFRKKKASA